MEWDCRLEKLGIFSLMNMPHFGHTGEVNTCVKQLLDSFSGGRTSIYVDLISFITRLPKVGVDPTRFFVGKEHDLSLAA